MTYFTVSRARLDAVLSGTLTIAARDIFYRRSGSRGSMLPKVMLAKTALHVSVLGYGTRLFGTVVDQGRANELLDAFVALGGNFVDTARCYGDWVRGVPKGARERAVGAWLRTQTRKDLVIATKSAFMDLRARDWAPRVNPCAIASQVAESLEHLQIDQIDLWWLDADDLLQPVASIIDTLIVHQQAGRIRYFGASNWSPARIAEAQAYAKSIGHQGFVAAQPFWGLAAPNRENATAQGYGFYYDEGFAPLHAAGMPMIPYAGQSRGFFSKLAANGVQGLSEPLAAMYLNDVNRKRARAVRAFAADCGVSINEIVLAYMLCQPNQTIPIIDATCPEQLWECAKAANVSLLTQDIAFLRAGL